MTDGKLRPMDTAPRDGTWVLAEMGGITSLADGTTVVGGWAQVQWKKDTEPNDFPQDGAWWPRFRDVEVWFEDFHFTGWLPIPGSEWKPTHRHRKGGLYRVVGPATIEADMTPAVVYEGRNGGMWVRPASEFYDGRFTPVEDGQ